MPRRRVVERGLNRMASVFMGYYAPSDEESVGRIASDLRRQGFDLWYKEDLKPGQTWMPQIQQALSRADFMLVFLSQNSLKGNFSKRVFEIAFQSQATVRAPKTIAVLLERVELPSLLSVVPSVDFTRSHDEGMRQLSRALERPSGPRRSRKQDTNQLAREVTQEMRKELGLKPETKTYRKAPKVDPKRVFVIMAFQKGMEEIYRGIRAAGVSHGLTVERVKDVQGDYRITDKIIEMITNARLVVADLTHERPNVYFELGYARALGKTVITIVREDHKVHFDAQDWQYISYNNSRMLKQKLKKRFEFELKNKKKK
jgi:TIR domain